MSRVRSTSFVPRDINGPKFDDDVHSFIDQYFLRGFDPFAALVVHDQISHYHQLAYAVNLTAFSFYATAEFL